MQTQKSLRLGLRWTTPQRAEDLDVATLQVTWVFYPSGYHRQLTCCDEYRFLPAAASQWHFDPETHMHWL